MDKTWIRSLRCLSLVLVSVLAFGPVAQATAAVHANAANVEGRVVVAADGDPAVGVKYHFVNVDTFEVVASAATDENGRIVADSLPAGTYLLSVEAPEGYVAAAAPLLNLAEGASADIEVALLPQEEEDWYDYAIKDTAASAEGSMITLSSGVVLMVDANTEWLGDLVSTSAIDNALDGSNVCVAYEGVDDDGEAFQATAVHAMTCSDELAAAFAAAGAGAAPGGGFGTMGVLAGLAGAAGAALGITALTDDDGPEIISQ